MIESSAITINSMSLRNEKHKNDTALSSVLWKLKKSTRETTKLTWSVLKVVSGYSNNSPMFE